MNRRKDSGGWPTQVAMKPCLPLALKPRKMKQFERKTMKAHAGYLHPHYHGQSSIAQLRLCLAQRVSLPAPAPPPAGTSPAASGLWSRPIVEGVWQPKRAWVVIPLQRQGILPSTHRFDLCFVTATLQLHNAGITPRLWS